MTREEFEKKVVDIAGCKAFGGLTDDEYRDIEYVYTWYPAISETKGKEQIAWLYINFGMCVIRDMYETASLAEDLDDDLKEAERKVNSIKNRIERLRKGDRGYGTEEDD